MNKNRNKLIAAALVLFASVAVFGFVFIPAGSAIEKTGRRMSRIRSVNGNSVAEAYYQEHGEIYQSIGEAVKFSGIVLCIAGIGASVCIALPVFFYNKEKLSSFSNDIKDRTARAAREFTAAKAPDIKPTNPYRPVGIRCPGCGKPLPSYAAFCSGCGRSVKSVPEVRQTVCPTCGTAVSKGNMFCTKCGTAIPNASQGEDAPQSEQNRTE